MAKDRAGDGLQSVRDFLIERKLDKFDQQPFKKLLGEETPDVARSPVGRMRLVRMMRNKFGVNFRANEQARQALDSFDEESDLLKKVLLEKGFVRG